MQVHKPMTAAELAEARELEGTATPGPWEYSDGFISGATAVAQTWAKDEEDFVNDKANGAFIAARTLVPRLLDDVEHFKVNNRYQRGYHDGQLEGLGRRGQTFREIEAECERNDVRWGADRMQSWGLWSMILGEEVGELNQAMLEHQSMNMDWPEAVASRLARIEEEAIQVAAVAVEIIRDAQRRRAELSQVSLSLDVMGD